MEINMNTNAFCRVLEFSFVYIVIILIEDVGFAVLFVENL